MKIKSKIIFMIICVTLILLTFMQTVAYATLVTDNSKKMYIGIEELRRNDEPNLGYSVGDPNTNGATGESNKIWSLVEFTGPSDTDNLKANGNKNIYCLKVGVGFSNTNKRATYDVFFNMKTERTQIEAQNDILEELVGGTVPYKASSTASVVQISRYNALLALGDMLYLMEDSEQEKEKYLNAAGIYSEYWDSTLTRDEISAVQQMAIWYFTNYEAGKTTFDKTGDDTTGWLWYTEDGKTYRNFAQYNPSNVDINSSHGSQRQQQAEMLYRYLIQTAKSKASEYDASKLNQEAPVSLDTAYLDYEEVGTNYIMGPIHMSANANNPVNYEMDFVVKNNGTATTGYQLLNSSKQPVAAGTTVKSLVGQDFYISMPVATTGYVEVEANVRYTNRNQILWTADGIDGDSTQPVLIPSKKAESMTLTLDVMPSAKEFDLSLRKYITKVGDEVLAGAKSRVPVIDVSPIMYLPAARQMGIPETTAIYQHRKDPIVVRTNEKIIYNITIYNEGEKAGRATKIVDQLPQGLRYDRVVSGNFVLDSYNETTNTLNLKRAAGNNTNLAPFVDRDELDSETIQIECTVTAYAAANKQVLTNLAWISEEIDGESGVTITTQRRLDRDSEPATITKYNKAELVTADNGYTGNTSNEGQDLASPDSYFEGQQDDDDFEKVVINPATGSYNIQLIKVAENDVTKKLQGAQFEITLANGTKNTYTTDANGSLNINDINITAAGVENITIKETVAPKGYSKIIDTIILKVKKEIVNGEYKGTVEALTKEDGTAVPTGTTHTVDGNTIKVTVPNREKTFDLALRKYITKAGEKELNGADTRAPSIDRTTLDNGTTATYKHRKDPVPVKTGEKVIYNLAIYNEGEKSGRATKVVDQLPTGLQFNRVITSNFVVESYNETTNTLNLKRADGNSTNLGPYTGNANPASEVIQIECTVVAEATTKNDQILTNLAWISEEFDEDANRTITNVKGQDRDSEPSTITTKTKDELVTTDNGYIGNTSNNGKDLADRNSYFEGQQDDDDFEKIIIPKKIPVDLALRKFIVAVSKDENIEDSEYLKNEDGSYKRAPVVDSSKLNTKDDEGNLITTAIYNHTKEPVLVQRNDIVVYMLRVYNEGDIDGYAAEIKDHLPPHLEFVDSEFNKQYGWDVSEDGRTVTTKYLSSEEYLIKKAKPVYEGETTGFIPDEDGNVTGGSSALKYKITHYELDYKEVPIMCKVKDTAPRNENITNIADITKYEDEEHKPVEDRDSQEDNVDLPEDKDLPGYKDDEKGDYVPGQQDDDDFEKVIVKKFDLALRKWVTQAIVTDKNGTTVTNTGHQPYDDPEGIVKVELDKKNLSQVTVKFRYSIRVINEGDIEGYAKEVTDYIPEGLRFIAADNPGWTDEGNNVISTRLLENTLLKPGEYADVEVLLTWINNSNNMGLKVNTAEISEDYNDYDVPDEDSTPDNEKPGEDDIDDAPVMLSVKTGKAVTYIGLGLAVLVIMASGVTLIKKYVM